MPRELKKSGALGELDLLIGSRAEQAGIGSSAVASRVCDQQSRGHVPI